MKKLIWGAWAGVAVIVAALGWYLASPALAMSGLRDAVAAGDKAEMGERVDFPAVRESLKTQFRMQFMAELAKDEENNAFAAFGLALANAVIEPLIDSFVSPDGMKALVERGKLERPNGGDQTAPAEPANSNDWNIERDGLSTFRATPMMDIGEPRPTLIFRRDGLSWDLVDIEIPDDLFKDAKDTKAE